MCMVVGVVLSRETRERKSDVQRAVNMGSREVSCCRLETKNREQEAYYSKVL